MSEDIDGDAELAGFCRREHPRLVGALSLYTGSRAAAQEIAQETLVRVMEAWPRVGQMDAPGAWAHRVAMNLAKSSFRRKGAERRAVRRLGHELHETGEDVPTRLAVRAAVATLPERQRRCLVLLHYLGWPPDQVAASFGISTEAVASLNYRAMQNLRRQFGAEIGSGL